MDPGMFEGKGDSCVVLSSCYLVLAADEQYSGSSMQQHLWVATPPLAIVMAVKVCKG